VLRVSSASSGEGCLLSPVTLGPRMFNQGEESGEIWCGSG
jgi:hypothetical protein